MPTTIAPALRSRATTGWSRVAGSPVQAGDPSVQTSPATATLSLTAIGTPASGQGEAGERGVDGVRLGQRGLAADHPERADPGVDRVDVGQVGADDVHRRHLAGTHQPGDLGGRQADRRR